MQLRILLALALVLILQSVSAYVGSVGLQAAASRAAEVKHAARMETMVAQLTYACRETMVGDNYTWPNGESAVVADALLQELQSVRRGLRFGNDTLGLSGSADRDDDAEQQALQFGSVGSPGLDARMVALERDVIAIVSVYASPDVRSRLSSATSTSTVYTHVGHDPVALDANEALRNLYNATFGDVMAMLRRSVSLYVALRLAPCAHLAPSAGGVLCGVAACA